MVIKNPWIAQPNTLIFHNLWSGGSSQNFTFQPVNPWKQSVNRTGPNDTPGCAGGRRRVRSDRIRLVPISTEAHGVL